MQGTNILAVCSFILLLTCSNTEHTENQSQVQENTVNKGLLLNLVNNLRTQGCKCGNVYYPPVGKLVWNSVLEEVALKHSQDMASKNYFSHTAKDGSMTPDRLEQAKYDWQSYGENIYRTGGYSADERESFQAWRDSPGHCSNLMGEHFKEMGVAKFNNYWTQVFGSQMPR